MHFGLEASNPHLNVLTDLGLEATQFVNMLVEFNLVALKFLMSYDLFKM
jgi:hypothetical protein